MSITEQSPNSGIESLLQLAQNPNRIIPPQLKIRFPNMRCLQLPFYLGRMDQEFLPELQVILVQESSEILNEEPESSFDQAILQQKMLALRRDLISEESNVIASIISHPVTNRGVFSLGLILDRAFRGKGIGQCLYEHLEQLYREVGFQYCYGDNSSTSNFDFFIKNGHIPTTKLRPEIADPRSEIYLGVQRRDRHTVRFYNEELKHACLIPQENSLAA